MLQNVIQSVLEIFDNVFVHQIDVPVAVGKVPLAAHGGFQPNGKCVALAILHRDDAHRDLQTVLV